MKPNRAFLSAGQPCLDPSATAGFLLQLQLLAVTFPRVSRWLPIPPRSVYGITIPPASGFGWVFKFFFPSLLPLFYFLNLSAIPGSVLLCHFSASTISRQAVMSLHWGYKMEELSEHCSQRARETVTGFSSPLPPTLCTAIPLHWN